jgi:hypothetical protein
MRKNMRLDEILEQSETVTAYGKINEIINSKQKGKIYLYYIGFIMKDRAKKENKKLRDIQGLLNYASSKNHCGMFQIKKYEELYYYFFRR